MFRCKARKKPERDAYIYTLSGAVYSAIPMLSGQMSVFQQPQTCLNFGQVNTQCVLMIIRLKKSKAE